jgi:hypothetical protein
MGHDLRTHQKHYGRWTTDEDKRESVMRAVGTLMAAGADDRVIDDAFEAGIKARVATS